MKSKQLQLNMLGLAQRAGKLTSGDELVAESIKKNQAKLVVIAQDTSPKTMAKFKRLCQENNLQLVSHFTSDQISQAIGRGRKILAIQDAGMSKKFLSYDQRNEEDNDIVK